MVAITGRSPPVIMVDRQPPVALFSASPGLLFFGSSLRMGMILSAALLLACLPYSVHILLLLGGLLARTHPCAGPWQICLIGLAPGIYGTRSLCPLFSFQEQIIGPV
jgi:hypothetical protein